MGDFYTSDTTILMQPMLSKHWLAKERYFTGVAFQETINRSTLRGFDV